MPPDTSLYFSVDLLQLTGENTTGALVDTVRGILERLGEDVAEPDDLIADLDAELRASAGFDFSNDIQPWIGRTIGVGIMDETGIHRLRIDAGRPVRRRSPERRQGRGVPSDSAGAPRPEKGLALIQIATIKTSELIVGPRRTPG